MVHTCDSNKFTQRKRGSYFIIGTVLSYIKLFLMFPGINLLLLLCSNTYSWFKQKASQNRGFVRIPWTPWLWACIHTYMHACMYPYIHPSIHTYMHTYIHTYIVHTYIHTYIHQDEREWVARPRRSSVHTCLQANATTTVSYLQGWLV